MTVSLRMTPFAVSPPGRNLPERGEAIIRQTGMVFKREGVGQRDRLTPVSVSRSSPILRGPLVSERHCGSGGAPIEDEQEGESPAFRAGKGKEFPTCESR